MNTNRRGFLSILTGFLTLPQFKTDSPKSKKAKPKVRFIITTPQDMAIDQPIIVDGVDRLDATMQLGLTIWTEEEWKEALKTFEGYKVKPARKLVDLRNEQYRKLEGEYWNKDQ